MRLSTRQLPVDISDTAAVWGGVGASCGSGKTGQKMEVAGEIVARDVAQ